MLIASFMTAQGIELRVTSEVVADSAFTGRDDITRVTIAENVTAIGNYAFADCRNLAGIVFEPGSRVASVGRYAFAGCASLGCMKLPGSIGVFGEGALRWCASLRHVEFPAGLKRLEPDVCSGCEALETALLPATLEVIGNSAFMECRSLREIKLPPRLKSVGPNAFGLCESLARADIPASVTEVGSYAFAGCRSLRSVMLPANPSLLGELIFSDCPALRRIVELAPAPPGFDCLSSPAEPDDTAFYERCVLEVNADETGEFRKAPGWGLFRNIRAYGAGNAPGRSQDSP